MGLATPTAVMVGIGKSSKDGALIKSGETLEKIAQANTYVFDKTGTLTTGNFTLNKINCFDAIDEKEIRSIVRSLEVHSNHPIAISLTKELKESNQRELTEIKETKGVSVEGIDENKNTWKVGSFKILNEKHDSEANLYVLKNNLLVAEIFIEDELKKDAIELINFLKTNKKRIVLMSGDQKKRCTQIANQLNINEFHYELLPEEKLTHIKKLTKDNVVVMIGDGINDAPALSIAHVGISFGNATEIAKNSSEVVIIGGNNLSKVIKAIENSHLTLKTIKQNLFWALAYNVIAIPIAAIGLLSPIIAAGSMAFSDLVVIGNSVRLKFK
jgi:Cu+-exporting ATPase